MKRIRGRIFILGTKESKERMDFHPVPSRLATQTIGRPTTSSSASDATWLEPDKSLWVAKNGFIETERNRGGTRSMTLSLLPSIIPSSNADQTPREKGGGINHISRQLSSRWGKLASSFELGQLCQPQTPRSGVGQAVARAFSLSILIVVAATGEAWTGPWQQLASQMGLVRRVQLQSEIQLLALKWDKSSEWLDASN